MNGSSRGDMHAIGTASGGNQIHQINETTSEAGSIFVVI